MQQKLMQQELMLQKLMTQQSVRSSAESLVVMASPLDLPLA